VSDADAEAAIQSILDACAALADDEDDALRMYALRVDALTRSLLDSVVVSSIDTSRPGPAGG
jgi:hypothetical protein